MTEPHGGATAVMMRRDGSGLRQDRRSLLCPRSPRHHQVPTLVIALAVLDITWRFKIPEPLLIATGAAAGLIIVSLR